MNNVIIKGKNLYSWEGEKGDKTWKIEVTHGQELLTDEIVKALEDFKESIFFNETNSSYWFMDFKIKNVWVEGFKIDPANMFMKIGLYN